MTNNKKWMDFRLKVHPFLGCNRLLCVLMYYREKTQNKKYTRIVEEGFKLAKLTRSGIAYNLEDSPHMTTVDYPSTQITYVFSSDLYKRMFLERIEQNRSDINTSLTNRFGFAISNNILCDIKLYLTVEKRGFLIFADGIEITSPRNFTLEGENIVKKEMEDDVFPELENIAALRNAGIITDEEYEIMKSRIKGVSK